MLLKSFLVAAAAALAVVGPGPAPLAAAEPPTVTNIHIGPGPAPVLTQLCGFPVTSEIVGTVTLIAAPDEGRVSYHEHGHRTGYWTGPTGNTLKLTTSLHIVHREQQDGTLVEVRTGRISIFQSGRQVTDLASGENLILVGHPTPVSEHCEALAP